MPSVDQLISFQLTKLRQTLLKFYLLRVFLNIDLLNDYLKNLIDSYIPSSDKKSLFGHELPFQ